MAEPVAWPCKTRELQSRVADSTIWNEFAFRDGDIIIATFAKSGTTWMQQIVGQLLFNGDPDLQVWRLSPWLDFRLDPKPEKLALLAAQSHRRFIKTHLPLDALVFSPQARYVYVARDGRDAAWSMYHHQAKFTQATRDEFNNQPGVDAPLSVAPPSDIREFWRGWLDQSGFFGHVRGWWAIRDLPNVLLVHYVNLKRDMPGEIRRVAGFLDVPIEEARWDAILEHCSFDWMKANAEKFTPRQGVQWEGGPQTFIHRGVNGRWKDTLSAKEVADYEARALRELGPDCAHWLATGEMGERLG